MEDEENAAKHQLTAMHQQRVLERINKRKKEAMKCYTQALTKANPDVSSKSLYFLNKFHKAFSYNINLKFIKKIIKICLFKPQVVEKCLQKLLRTLHKDRSHALAHYRHILSSQKNGIEAAGK